MANIFNRSPQKKSKDTVIHQFVFIEAPIAEVFKEIVAWGESPWWPQSSLWKYQRVTDGEISVWTKYLIKIKKPSAPDWAAEVSKLEPPRLIERTFSKGMFKGFEVVALEERANGTRVDYELHFQIQGPLNFVLWPFLLKPQYVQTIQMILTALKNYLTTEGQRTI